MRLLGSNLACFRGGRQVFRGINFELGPGDALLVTGRNGVGKSSLLRVVAGLLRAAEGSLDLVGGTADLTIGEQAHYVGHLDAVKPSLTVLENLRFWARYLGSAVAGAEAALAAIGLDTLADLPASYLSAGQRRRLSLARLFAAQRPLWLLDEPTSSLDLSSQQQFEALMRQHLSAGGLVVAATHAPLALAGARELRLGTTG
jgi:heme exporter protein A